MPATARHDHEQLCKHDTMRLHQNMAFNEETLLASTHTIDISIQNVLRILGMGVTRHSIKKGYPAK